MPKEWHGLVGTLPLEHLVFRVSVTFKLNPKKPIESQFHNLILEKKYLYFVKLYNITLLFKNFLLLLIVYEIFAENLVFIINVKEIAYRFSYYFYFKMNL